MTDLSASDELRRRFEGISTMDELVGIAGSAVSDDGETDWLEFKGAPKSDPTAKDFKRNLLSKEIGAFANTYGGIVVVHAADDRPAGALRGFDGSKIGHLNRNIASWLPNSLDPPLAGLRIKQCDGVLMILVPESPTKPHRSRNGRYYHRIDTDSHEMPETMVAALYNAGRNLVVDPVLSFDFLLFDQLRLTFGVRNRSRVAGTNPHFAIAVYAYFEESEAVRDLRWQASVHDEFYTPGVAKTKHPALRPENRMRMVGSFESASPHRGRILYPEDQMIHFRFTDSNSALKPEQILIVEFWYAFLEAKPGTAWIRVTPEAQSDALTVDPDVVTEWVSLLK